jgi:hypothetical protein
MPAQGLSPSGDFSGKMAHFVRKHMSLLKYTENNLDHLRDFPGAASPSVHPCALLEARRMTERAFQAGMP